MQLEPIDCGFAGLVELRQIRIEIPSTDDQDRASILAVLSRQRMTPVPDIGEFANGIILDEIAKGAGFLEMGIIKMD